MSSAQVGGLSDGEPVYDGDGDARAEADALIGALYARQPENAVERRLDATARVLELLGHPERSYGIIHVTGTNGKSSTARIAGSILRAHGLRVGVFTSPHLVRLTERIDIDGPLRDAVLLETWRDVAPYIGMVDAELAAEGRAPLTFFEAVTVIAFAAFADSPCDVIVLEVGMGGEWDSTNVADGDVAVFTPIAMDHAQYLGSTIAEIAATKAGIIKPNAIVVSAEQRPEAIAAIRERAEAADAPVRLLGVDFALEDARLGVGGQEITVQGLAGRYQGLLLPLIGAHQARNAAVAIAAVEALLGGGEHAIATDVLEEGLLRAVSPGRLQLVATDPAVVLDAAHNPHGAATLAQALTEAFAFSSTVGIVGILADKDADGLLRELEPVLDTVIAVASDSPRALPADEVAERARAVFGEERVITAETVADALEHGRSIARENGGGVVVTGSITVIGEVAALLASTDRGQASPGRGDE